MDTDDILCRYAEHEGWNNATLVLLLAEYIDNQKAPDAFDAFLETKVTEGEFTL